jgi:hypothetical protein
MLFDVDHSVFDHFVRFVMFVNMNILVERSKPTERSDVIFLGVERGCFALGFGDVLSESRGFFLRKVVVPSFRVAGHRFGFRFGFEVGDFRFGVVASGESLVRFVAGISIRFGSLGGGGTRLRRLFGVAFSGGLFVSGLAGFPFRD